MHAMLRTVANFTADCFRATVVLAAAAMVLIATAAPLLMLMDSLSVAVYAVGVVVMLAGLVLATTLVLTVGLRLVAILMENYLD